MVAALLSLRFRVLANTLRRNPVQLAAVILGAIPLLALLAAEIAGFALSSQAPPHARQLIAVAAGAAIVAGWLIVPLFLDGVDDTLSPRRLARFPIPTGRLMTATVAAGLTWIPGAATLTASVAMALAWIDDPWAATAAVAAGVLGTLTCIAGSRALTGLADMLLRGRSAARAAVLALLIGVLVVPAGIALMAAADPRTDMVGPAVAFIESTAWTPLGAAWSIAGHVSARDAGGAVAATLIAVATAIALAAVWRVTLVATARGGSASTGLRGRAGPGMLGLAPTGVAGAVAARSLIYWFRDARRARQLLLIPAIPVTMLLWWRLLDSDAVALAIGPVVAALLPLSAFAELSYDGTAFAAQVAAGIRGRADRLGRAVALLVIAAPTTVVVQIGVIAITGRWADLPALLGLCLGVLLTASGVAAVSSAVVVVPVPRAGRNPFAAPAGAATLSIAASYAVLGATAVIASPVIAVFVAAVWTGAPALGWITLAAGVLVGCAGLAGGVLIGGRILDRTAPETLARLHLMRE
ncbi:hypothetical protein P0L94_16980 [Microbacter sp. GSS18]|nr:hypothetical protein P0L94_16980 [Microbacter sp. GSS18]